MPFGGDSVCLQWCWELCGYFQEGVFGGGCMRGDHWRSCMRCPWVGVSSAAGCGHLRSPEVPPNGVDIEIAGGISILLRECFHHVPHTSTFTTEYKVEAADRVIDSGRTIAEVSRELGLAETLLGKWFAEERRRIDAAAAVAVGDPYGQGHRGDDSVAARRRTAAGDLRQCLLRGEQLTEAVLRRDGAQPIDRDAKTEDPQRI